MPSLGMLRARLRQKDPLHASPLLYARCVRGQGACRQPDRRRRRLAGVSEAWRMTELSIVELDRVEAVFAPRDWAFARERAAEIGAHWAGLAAANPPLFNGPVLLQYERCIEANGLQAPYPRKYYPSFIAC